jgi:hypothetical protein
LILTQRLPDFIDILDSSLRVVLVQVVHCIVEQHSHFIVFLASLGEVHCLYNLVFGDEIGQTGAVA